MPLQNHLVELERKHRALEREIEDAIAHHPAVGDGKLAELKRKKLVLKDEILKIKDDPRPVH